MFSHPFCIFPLKEREKDGARSFMLAHPNRKNKNAVRVGHPKCSSIREDTL
jgi:hypothetical protein